MIHTRFAYPGRWALRPRLPRMSIRDWPEQERPREKLLAEGAARLTDAELLAVLFGTGFRGVSAVDLGGRLLREFGCLRGLMSADRERCSVHAWPRAPAATGCMQAALELSRRHYQQEAAVGPGPGIPGRHASACWSPGCVTGPTRCSAAFSWTTGTG